MNTKRKKNSRQRASKTHGWGAMKKHRGSGNKGGRGNAGTGKRSDCKKPSVWSIDRFYGGHGFTPVGGIKHVSSCNIEMLERNYHKLLKEGIVKEEKDVCAIDLDMLGVQKLLSKGHPTKKWSITTKEASVNAVEKIKEKGGQVVTENEEAVAKASE